MCAHVLTCQTHAMLLVVEWRLLAMLMAATRPTELTPRNLSNALHRYAKTAGVAHDRDPIDPKSDPRLHGGIWVPWE